MKSKKIHFQRMYWTIAGIVLVLSNLFPLFARAGGAGGSYSHESGGHGGDGGGDGIGFLIYLIIRIVPFPYNIFVIIALFAGGYITAKKKGMVSPLNQIPQQYSLPDITQVSAHTGKPVSVDNFNEADFLLKVKTAFAAIQNAWSQKDLSGVRKYITDGIYQRFKTQFLMMDILKQKNLISDIEIFSVKIVQSETDGPYESITVLISAKAYDRFINEVLPNVNSEGGMEYFSEYWSFIKKKGVSVKDLYNSSQCPGCGAEIAHVEGGVSRCPYCRKLLNTGEYDWVLAEITQSDDYLNSRQPVRKQQKLNELIEKIQSENPDFSVQVIEDRASNMFLHLLTADTRGSLVHAKRYVSDSYYQKAEKQGYFLENNMVFNRLYLNSVSLIAIGKRDGKNLLAVSIKQSSQRLIRKDSKFSLFDQGLLSWNWVVFLERDELSSQPAGAVTAYSCPHCGGELQDTVDINCQYCGEPLNSTRFDWVLTDCMFPDAFASFQQEHPDIFDVSLEPDPTVLLYKVRDYALNNVMVLLASDGVFAEAEKEFAKKISKKWGYDIRQLEGFLQLAMSGRLVIRMPEDRKMRENIFRLMTKAAEADNEISPAEQNLLDSIKRTYLVSNA